MVTQIPFPQRGERTVLTPHPTPGTALMMPQHSSPVGEAAVYGYLPSCPRPSSALPILFPHTFTPPELKIWAI